MRIFGGLVTLGMLALVVRSSTLMMFPDPLLESKAQNQFKKAQEIHGRRGDILSRDGSLFATSVEVEDLHADPSKLTRETATVLARTLGPLLELPIEPTRQRLSRKHRQDVLLARDLVPGQMVTIQAAVDALTEDHPTLAHALFTRKNYRRYYPANEEAAPLLGVVGRNNSALAGLERTLDRHLHGETFKYVQWRDRKGRRITTDAPQARPGRSVVLTLDRNVQRLAEEALDRVIELTEADGAHALVIEPATGEILAMAQRPTHNPNNLEQLKRQALRNGMVEDVFEPGSVFKPFIVAAALEEGVVTTDSRIDCENGRFRIGRSVIHDDHPKSFLSVAEIIKFSSNIGSAKMAFSLGPERTVEYLDDFGFGRSTNLGLGGEATGFVRSAQTIKPIELATTAYGHGVNATTLQLATALATLANGGLRMDPHIIREIRDESGSPIRVFSPKVDRRVVSEETASAVIDMMVTVTEPGGTGTRAQVPGYRVAGKTGTAWKHEEGGGYSSTERMGSFIGLLPADDPKLAIAIVVDSPKKGSKYGGVVAAPAFAEIGIHAMRLMSIPPDPTLLDSESAVPEVDEASTPTGAPELRWSARGHLITPDLSGLSMRDALVTLEGAGLDIRVKGSGRVVRQTPRPGRTIRPGQSVEVELK